MLFIAIPLLVVFLSVSAQAANFTVNTTLDTVDANPGDGVCETVPGNNFCSLRAAIEEANALAGDEQIIVPPNTYFLNDSLVITRSLTITGGGASTTIIDGSKSDDWAAPGRRRLVFILAGKGGFVPSVTLSGLTIRNSPGRGVESGGAVTLINIVVSDNSDGGIWNGANMTIINSTVSGNSAVLDGGGISNHLWLKLTNSTVSWNKAGKNGGGISNTSGGIMTITNSTVSGNSAVLDGGGIWNDFRVDLFKPRLRITCPMLILVLPEPGVASSIPVMTRILLSTSRIQFSLGILRALLSGNVRARSTPMETT